MPCSTACLTAADGGQGQGAARLLHVSARLRAASEGVSSWAPRGPGGCRCAVRVLGLGYRGQAVRDVWVMGNGCSTVGPAPMKPCKGKGSTRGVVAWRSLDRTRPPRLLSFAF